MEELISCVRNGANPSVTCFSSHVSNGSSAQDVGDLERVHSWYTGALLFVRIQARCDSRIVAYHRTNHLDLLRDKIGEM